MRVLFWSELFWPHVGGVEILAAQTVEGLRERGLDVAVVTSHDDSILLPDQGDHAGAPVYRLPLRAALASGDVDELMRQRRRVGQLKTELAVDLVHVFGLGPSTLFHLQTQRAPHPPVLVTMHGEVLRGGADRGDTVLEKTLASASAVLCVSGAVLDATRALAPEAAARTSLLYSGVRPTAAEVLAEPGIGNREPLLLCLGRFVRDKGFDLAIAAFASIAEAIPAARLVLAGDGPERAALEARAVALGLGDRVRFVGWVDADRVSALLAATSVLIMPSRREGLPLVAIQAAQMGVPVVGTSAGGLPEVVVAGETGLIVAPEDTEALATSIASLLRDRDAMQRMGGAARERADDVFGWERYLAATERVYAETVDRGRSS